MEGEINSLKEAKEELLEEFEILENEGKRCLAAGREWEVLTIDAHSKLVQQTIENK